ncbi:hypothetical protein [Paraburkholderia rhizosphaerae]|uniref:hypothetical protein n=1 Tax=Paraburkholderia rhizosphaerae TaxID=480658 RepID=UPI0010650DAA|nr:hypothetical protein [Paraburkholderia rhizosphaerae]
MSAYSIEALASACARIAEEAEFPTEYDGTRRIEPVMELRISLGKINDQAVACSNSGVYAVIAVFRRN